MTGIRLIGIVLCTGLMLNGCGGKEPKADQEKGAAPQQKGEQVRRTLITATAAQTRDIDYIQESVGQLESLQAPLVAAEVAGQITRMRVDIGQRVTNGQVLAEIDDREMRLARDTAQAEVKRLEALITNQSRQVERLQAMIAEKFATQSMLDEAESNLEGLRQQLAGARARYETAQLNLERTRIISPVDGEIEERLAAAGDYIRAGNPLFRIATAQKLRVLLPFPETVASRLRIGLTVELTTPTADRTVSGRIAEIRPMVSAASQAVYLVVEVVNPGSWKPGGSITGRLLLDRHKDAVAVPEQSVVQRPAGYVVYVINNDMSEQRVVETGARHEGWIEILSGVKSGETVAVDGAPYLSDKTAVKIQPQENRT